MGRLTWCFVVAVACATRAPAAPVTIEVDDAVSTMDFELCIADRCDRDTSRVDGIIEIALDDYETPQEITLHDSTLIFPDDLDLRVNVFMGHLAAAGRNIAARYGRPGTPHPPAPLTGSSYSLSNVPTDAEGTWTYQAAGTMCDLFLEAGLPCDGVFDLADMENLNAETVTGEVSLVGEDVTLLFEPTLTIPFCSAPDLAVINLTGTIVGHGTAPSCPERPGPVSDLRLVDTGDRIGLAWEPEPNATNGYRVYSVADKLLLPPNGSRPDADLECETLAPAATSCGVTHSGAPLLLYQVVGLCGDGSEGAN